MAVLAILAIVVVSGAAVQTPAGLFRPEVPVSSLEQLSGVPAAPRAARTPPGVGLDGPRTLSVSLPAPTSLSTVLQLLFRGTAFSTVVPPSVQGTFTGDLRDVTLRQALEAVLSPSGLGYDVRGTVIHIFPRTLTQEGRR